MQTIEAFSISSHLGLTKNQTIETNLHRAWLQNSKMYIPKEMCFQINTHKLKVTFKYSITVVRINKLKLW